MTRKKIPQRLLRLLVLLIGLLSSAQAYSWQQFARDTEWVNDQLMNGTTYVCDNYLAGVDFALLGESVRNGNPPMAFVGFGVSTLCYFPKLGPQARALGQGLADQVNSSLGRGRTPTPESLSSTINRFMAACDALRGGPSQMTVEAFKAQRSPRYKLAAVVGMGNQTQVLVCN